jgi:glucose-1-phosphate thymidylyltransferase
MVNDFTVIPPVYIHPSAEIEASVIGPYASIDANAKISNAIISNSIIDPGAVVRGCILENALVGENALVTGRAKALFLGDNSSVDLG